MLDDLKYIHQRDGSDALGVVEKQWQQLQQTYTVTVTPTQPVKNVVVAGMGGSALAATFIATWPGLSIPYEIARNYSIPSYVDANTLFVASSYSGNTEETLAALTEAEQKGAQIAVIATGGKLAERAQAAGYPLFELPANFQPRMAVFYNLAALINLFAHYKLIDASAVDDLSAAGDFGCEIAVRWRADVATSHNQAKQIALELVGKSPVIYGGPQLYPAAYKWKINFNENSKNIAWCNQFPEFNHNEFLGWVSHPVEKPYATVFLESSFDHPQVTKRFEITRRLLSGRMPDPIIIHAEGKTILEQLIWIVTLGDFVSLYLAFLNGIDPSPIELMNKFKAELG